MQYVCIRSFDLIINFGLLIVSKNMYMITLQVYALNIWEGCTNIYLNRTRIDELKNDELLINLEVKVLFLLLVRSAVRISL
jgi:hypothetical protein